MRSVMAMLVAVPMLMGNVDLTSGDRFTWDAAQSDDDQPKLFAARFDFDAVDTPFAPSPDSSAPATYGPAAGEATAAPIAETDPPKPPISMAEFCEALGAAARANDIPVSFFARLIWQESQFKFEEVSDAGALGVAQFMPDTAAESGLDDPFDPLQALPASARLLRKLRDQMGNLGLAAAAYNAGAGRIQNWLARRAPLPDETKNYVRRITGNPAETWTAEAKRIEIPRQLPAEAPCAGVAGLSRKKEVDATAVVLAPEIRTILQKVRLAEIAARERLEKARRRLAGRGSQAKLAQAVIGRRTRKADARGPTRLASAAER